MSCGIGRRHGSDPALLYLWHRQVAAALIQPLAWKTPYAMGVALKSKKKKKEECFSFLYLLGIIPTASLLVHAGLK